MQILSIASGKGGVGKSLLAANLSIALAEAGRRVILADLDLGGSNLHVFLGLRSIKKGIGTFLGGEDFSNIIIKTEYENLEFIPGDAEIPGLANLSYVQKRKLIRLLKSQDADFLVLDLGAGTSYNTLDFFLMAIRGIIITAPTIIATLNAYLFLKNTVFRIIQSVFRKRSSALAILKETIGDKSTLQELYLPKILEKLQNADPDHYNEYREKMNHYIPRLIINMAYEPGDSKMGEKLNRYVNEYLNMKIEHLGIIYRDSLQVKALNARIPIIKYKPDSVLSQAIYRIADKIMQYEGLEESPVDIETLDGSFHVVNAESKMDFQYKLDGLEELLHCGALTMGDLIETVKHQQFEINQLKRENYLLKSKLMKAIKEGFKT